MKSPRILVAVMIVASALVTAALPDTAHAQPTSNLSIRSKLEVLRRTGTTFTLLDYGFEAIEVAARVTELSADAVTFTIQQPRARLKQLPECRPTILVVTELTIPLSEVSGIAATREPSTSQTGWLVFGRMPRWDRGSQTERCPMGSQ